jgi:hypothetical protein
MEKKWQAFESTFGRFTDTARFYGALRTVFSQRAAETLDRQPPHQWFFQRTEAFQAFTTVKIEPLKPGEEKKVKPPARAEIPESRRFDTKELTARYTYGFSSRDYIYFSRKAGQELPLFLTLSGRTRLLPVQETAEREHLPAPPAPAPYTIDLGFPVFKSPAAYPSMFHFSPDLAGAPEVAVKTIEKKITTEVKRLDTEISRRISRSPMPGINLSKLADTVYQQIVERVKKERQMRGY